jgi:hypothetical protein
MVSLCRHQNILRGELQLGIRYRIPYKKILEFRMTILDDWRNLIVQNND